MWKNEKHNAGENKLQEAREVERKLPVKNAATDNVKISKLVWVAK